MADRTRQHQPGQSNPPTHSGDSGGGVGPLGLVGPALVHVFTASGIVTALFATYAVLAGEYTTAFAWLGLALFIDGIDGTFARWLEVGRRLPRFSGEKLDLVVDYVTYVFVPVLALVQSRILIGAPGQVLACGILMSSLYHFSDTASKTEDHCFVGFPAIWNIVTFYLFAFPLPRWVTYLLIGLCIALTFVPMRWLHPLRVERLLWLNIAATLVWCWGAGVTLLAGFPATGWSAMALIAVAIYGVVLAVTSPLAKPPAGN